MLDDEEKYPLENFPSKALWQKVQSIVSIANMTSHVQPYLSPDLTNLRNTG